MTKKGISLCKQETFIDWYTGKNQTHNYCPDTQGKSLIHLCLKKKKKKQRSDEHHDNLEMIRNFKIFLDNQIISKSLL